VEKIARGLSWQLLLAVAKQEKIIKTLEEREEEPPAVSCSCQLLLWCHVPWTPVLDTASPPWKFRFDPDQEWIQKGTSIKSVSVWDKVFMLTLCLSSDFRLVAKGQRIPNPARVLLV